MSELKSTYESMSVEELENLLNNAALDPTAKALCKAVINQKRGTNAYSVPDASAIENMQTTGPKIALWDPRGAAGLSLVFGPLFGSFLHTLNWRAIGDSTKFKVSAVWTLIFALSYLPFFIAGFSLIAIVLAFVGLPVWYIFSARTQIRYVSDELYGLYSRKSWVLPIVIFLVYVFLSDFIWIRVAGDRGLACDSSEAITLVKKIVKENIEEKSKAPIKVASMVNNFSNKPMSNEDKKFIDQAETNIQKWLKKLSINVNNIRADSFDKDISRYKCKAELQIMASQEIISESKNSAPQLHMLGAFTDIEAQMKDNKSNIVYTVQKNTEDQIFVELSFSKEPMELFGTLISSLAIPVNIQH